MNRKLIKHTSAIQPIKDVFATLYVDWVELVSRCFCVNRPRKDFLSHKYSSAKEIISGDTASSSDGRRDYYERVELGGIDEEEEDPQCILKAAPKGRFLVLFFKPHPHSG